MRILLAEDNRFNQVLAKRILEKMGCQVEVAQTGKEAIEKLESTLFNVVLMDIQMPEMDGYEATRRIRTGVNERTNKIPIIAMTAHALNDAGSKCIEAGMNDYISKPFEPDALYAMISNLVTEFQRELPRPSPVENTIIQDGLTEKDLDLAYLKGILGGSAEGLPDLLNILLMELPVMGKNLETAGLTKNWTQLKHVAHKMRSCIMMINKPHFLSLLNSIEKYTSEDIHLELLPELVSQAVAINLVVIAQVKTELSKLQAKTVGNSMEAA